MSDIRAAAVAGTWYPAEGDRLVREVDAYLEAAEGTPPVADLVALIAPHAGLMYSGPVAAHAYRQLLNRPIETIVLVGPSHFMAFDGVALYPSGAFETPLGNVAIDESLGAELAAASPIVQPLPAAHRREHSLEMQLPFIKRLLPGAAIVPLLMGFQTRETIEALAAALGRVAPGRRLLLVASTDLSHYFDAPTARKLDARVQDCVEAFDASRLLDVFEQYPEVERGRYVACGGGPAIAVMLAARARGAEDARVLKYMHSGEISGDNSGVVGYLAGAFGTFTDVH